MNHRVLLASLFVLAACGDKTNPQDGVYDFAGSHVDLAGTPPDGFSRDFAGITDDMGDVDLSGDDLAGTDFATNPNAPNITVLKPLSTEDVVGNTLNVKVMVTSPVSSAISSVTFMLAGGVNAVTLSSTGAGVYEGSTNVAGVPSMGMFTVTATDVASRARDLAVTYRHDVGPVVTILSPSGPTAQAMTTLRVTVKDDLYPVIDPTKVKASIKTPDDIALTPVMGSNPLELTASINFNSFNPPLDGPQRITVTAMNEKNTPGSAFKDFTVDKSGPVITINGPDAGEFVSGLQLISATITDISGVKDSTVSAVFAGNASFQVTLTRMGTTDVFQGSFNTRLLGTSYVQPILSVRADDNIGNHGEVGEVVLVDNTPPVLSLDPPNLRVATFVQGTGWRCSALFDPVGGESANDGAILPQLTTVKARVEDNGNVQAGLLVERFSGIDPASVKLVVIPTPLGTEVLAVDTDNDGVCDDVNPKLVPTSAVTGSNQSVQVLLGPLQAVGTPNYFTSGSVATCDEVGDSSLVAPPPLLCTSAGTQMTYGLQYGDGTIPSIWTIPPVTSNQSGCIGFQLDTLNAIPNGGPACLVAIAKDKTLNHAVSKPMRICIQKTPGQCAGFVPTAGCTGKYDAALGDLVAGTCAAPVFGSGEIRKLQ